MKKSWKKILVFIVLVFLLVLIGGFVFASFLVNSLPSPGDFSVKKITESTKIYDKTGKILLYEVHGEEKRTVIPFEEIPDYVKKATLAAEDVDFYNQPAFDWKSIVRAFFINIREGRIAQGGSTITQQLAKNIFLSPEKTIIRKVKELVLAIQLESRYSKDEIFYFYLNQIPYGSNAYGIEAASQTFFGKQAKDLSLEEAALLASLPKAPTYYSPYGQHMGDLLKRRDYVLDQMVKAGFISEDQATQAKKKEIVFLPQSVGSIKAPHFSLMVKEYLEEKYGEQTLNQGGLKVITTLDWKLQEVAEKIVEEGAKKNEKNYKSRNAALVAEDPKTGQILVLVGSKNYFADDIKGNFNVITQGLRQPGSTLKPFVYLTAFQKGYSPETVLFDVKTQFDTRGGAESYVPENYDGTFHGPIQMQQALAWSQNVPAVKTLYLAGMDDTLENLKNFGISTLTDKNRYGLTLVLGGGEVRPIELLGAYAALSQDGVYRKQSFILKVEDRNGKTLEEFKQPEEKVVVDPQYPRLINKILSNTSLRSGLLQSSLPLTIFPGYDVALKTGTTQDYRDAWTFGYTPFITVGVWAGNTENTQMIKQGSSVVAAIPIWSNFMKEALKQYQPEAFVSPSPSAPVQKPMMNGEYVWVNAGKPEVHSILFYVDKNNPTNPSFPTSPASDPQFNNWESGVSLWATQNNIQSSYTPIKIVGDEGNKNLGVDEIIISGVTPVSGENKNGPFLIRALISAGTELERIELKQNGFLRNAINVSGKKFDYQYFFSEKLEKTNVIEITARNSRQKSQTYSFVVTSE